MFGLIFVIIAFLTSFVGSIILILMGKTIQGAVMLFLLTLVVILVIRVIREEM